MWQNFKALSNFFGLPFLPDPAILKVPSYMRSLPAEYDSIEALQKLDFETLKGRVYPCENECFQLLVRIEFTGYYYAGLHTSYIDALLTADIAMMLFGVKVDSLLHPNRFATSVGTQATWGKAGHAMDPSAAEELLETEEAVVEYYLEKRFNEILDVAIEEMAVADGVADELDELAVA